MAAAYQYADGGPNTPLPRELLLLRYIDRFGVHAIMGRPYLGAGEARRMATAERIVRMYEEREAAESWDDWRKENPEKWKLLGRAMEAAAKLEVKG